MGPDISPRSKTNCMTFRIISERLTHLHKESETKNISLNTLVNQIIKEHLAWHGIAWLLMPSYITCQSHS